MARPRTYAAERAARDRKAKREGWTSWQEKRYWARRLATEREVFRLGQRIDPFTWHRSFRYRMNAAGRVVPVASPRPRYFTFGPVGSILPRAAEDAMGGETHHGPTVWHRPTWKPRLVRAARASAAASRSVHVNGLPSGAPKG